MSSHRILYVGHDLALLKFLWGALRDYTIVRTPETYPCHTLLESEINYSLLLLDEKFPETTGPALARYARTLAHRERTPIIILSAGKPRCDCAGVCYAKPDDFDHLAKTITRLTGMTGRE